MFKVMSCKTSEYYDFFIPSRPDDRFKQIRKMLLSDTIFDCGNAQIEKETEYNKTATTYHKLARCAFSVYRYAATAWLVESFIRNVVVTDKLSDLIYKIPVNKNIKTLHTISDYLSLFPFLPILMVTQNPSFREFAIVLTEEVKHRFLFQNILGKIQNRIDNIFPNLANQRIISYLLSPSFCTISSTAFFAIAHLPNASTIEEQKKTLAGSISLFITSQESLYYQNFGSLIYPILAHLGTNYLACDLMQKYNSLHRLVILSYFTYLLLLIGLPTQKEISAESAV